MLEVTYYGNAAFAVATPETTALVDPYLTANEECPWDAETVRERERPDAVCVTHAAADHVGEASELAREGVPVITEPATERYLHARGVPEARTTSLLWGMAAEVGDLSIRVLEARHASIRAVDGELVSGTPLSFLFSHDGDSVYHMGDTSIFRGLQTHGDLHDPDVALVGVGQAFDAAADASGPVTPTISELSTEEAVLATRWVGADRAVPMHYLGAERERYLDAMAEEGVAEAVPLDPGESLRVE